MTKEQNPYEWHDKLIEGADKSCKAREEEINKGWEEYNNKIQKKIDEDQKIIDRASEAYLKEERRKREAESERHRQEAIRLAEEEAEQTLGIKSEKTKQIDNAWQEMVNNLKFED
ncbi:hypothetical protein [Streptococcus jiangjianxini]|uniref:hypothetical protein n=1 Tax=Streptococcus jiangjianxini TaxID=3161189 RepID=UPI0032EF367A